MATGAKGVGEIIQTPPVIDSKDQPAKLKKGVTATGHKVNIVSTEQQQSLMMQRIKNAASTAFEVLKGTAHGALGLATFAGSAVLMVLTAPLVFIPVDVAGSENVPLPASFLFKGDQIAASQFNRAHQIFSNIFKPGAAGTSQSTAVDSSSVKTGYSMEEIVLTQEQCEAAVDSSSVKTGYSMEEIVLTQEQCEAAVKIEKSENREVTIKNQFLKDLNRDFLINNNKISDGSSTNDQLMNSLKEIANPSGLGTINLIGNDERFQNIARVYNQGLTLEAIQVFLRELPENESNKLTRLEWRDFKTERNLLVESQDGKIPMHLRDGLRIHNSDTNNVTYWIINCDSEDVSVKNPNIRVKLEKYDQKPEGYETVSDE